MKPLTGAELRDIRPLAFAVTMELLHLFGDGNGTPRDYLTVAECDRLDIALRHLAERIRDAAQLSVIGTEDVTPRRPSKPFTMELSDDETEGYGGTRKCASGGDHCGNDADMLCTHCGLRFCFRCAGEHEESLS